METWSPYYKLESDGTRGLAQMAYEPLINKEGTVFCMNYNTENKYQSFKKNLGFVPELVHTFFDKELFYLDKFKHHSWCPNILDVDFKNKKIFLEWNNTTCNDIINSPDQLTSVCPNWKNQLEACIRDLLNDHVYKITLYPHCHYVNKDGNLKSFDYYGCFDFNQATLTIAQVNGLIHSSSINRINEAVSNNMLDLKVMFYRSLEAHIVWPDNFLNSVHQRLLNDKLV